mmetsp:Transcript_14203/g.29169  ORF Transcript_14203/g.29169 Transcript_14203/m.29169 type:complete len:303 (-) Transcript_14203:160-1068(-)|eukprot:CAMPEP_0118663780 /NCGR_PEP_ID=MMETSP0785-20121206/17627_1 /TAXON_ID=91992 /ORGANISM="Bolidomonas pacifica, Strain CCMP 1866" /LENGTH=302 /DNA_ID=CAMNT_0006557573 /DNA_START=114 /DNA_END=1022 /DNA_ORIENTATION=-
MLVLTAVLLMIVVVQTYALHKPTTISRARREFIAAGVSLPTLAAANPAVVLASPTPTTLSGILGARDGSQLTKSFLNVPPSRQSFPSWLEGTWECSEEFRGFEFPSKKIPKEKIVSSTQLPGFTKLSIARFGDVGRKDTRYKMKFVMEGNDVRENFPFNIGESISAHTDGREVVESVEGSAGNPNRITIRLRTGGRNGERVELFVNSRRSEVVNDEIFLCSELVRQVTLGSPTLQDSNVAMMRVGEYQHFWTFRKGEGEGSFRANILTAVYADAQQDASLFNEALGDPIIVYSHNLIGTRIT